MNRVCVVLICPSCSSTSVAYRIPPLKYDTWTQHPRICPMLPFLLELPENDSHSIMSNSLQPHGLYSPWNSPGQNTGVSSLSLLQGIFPTQESNPGLPHCRWTLYQQSHEGSPQSFLSSVQSLSRVRLFATPWIPAHQASLSITNSRSSLKLMSVESVMPSSHLILCHPHTLVRQCSKFSKQGFNSTWTMNLQMFKLDLEKAEEPEIKLDHGKNKRIPEKHLLLLHWVRWSLWLCGS